jgi:hypothetical protein
MWGALVFIGLKAFDFILSIVANATTPKAQDAVRALQSGWKSFAAYRIALKINSVEVAVARPTYFIASALTALLFHIGGFAGLAIAINIEALARRVPENSSSPDWILIPTLIALLIALPFWGAAMTLISRSRALTSSESMLRAFAEEALRRKLEVQPHLERLRRGRDSTIPTLIDLTAEPL